MRSNALQTNGLILLLGLVFCATAGCGSDPGEDRHDAATGADAGDGSVDSSVPPDGSEDAGTVADASPDAAIEPDAAPNECGNLNPTCTAVSVGPTGDPASDFPMPDDIPEPDHAGGDGVSEDASGFLQLDSTSSNLDVLWVADDLAYSVGFISKIRTMPFPDPPHYREIGRYVTVTCHSDPINGSTEGVVLGQIPSGPLCADGVHGCCSRDEVAPGAGGGHQPVQVIANRPSRIAADWNGDAWVSNRAHWWGGYTQPSVTKIANNLADCIDRNGNGQIDTSTDANDDGVINTDCDDNNLPDDFGTICAGGVAKEFYGLDDECILFTTNTEPSGIGRPVVLGPGPGDGPLTPSDAWAGMYATGTWYRLDGATGEIAQTVEIPGTNPYSAAIDRFGILWSPDVMSDTLHYFDTQDATNNRGSVQYPGGIFYGIAVDGYTEPDPITNESQLVQQIWLAMFGTSCAARYRPVRDQGFAGLANGSWAAACFESGVAQSRGIAADNRSPLGYAWVALDGYPTGSPGAVGRIPIDIPGGMTTQLPANYFTASTAVAYGTIGVAVSTDGDVWAVNQETSNVVHFSVGPSGSVSGAPDVVPLDDQSSAPETFCGQTHCKPHPYTYSDMAGFSLRNFTDPKGLYSWVESGSCPPGATRFLSVAWDADTPPGTAITLRIRYASDLADLETETWSDPYLTSPVDLANVPWNPTSHLQLAFELTAEWGSSPTLRSFRLLYECEQP